MTAVAILVVTLQLAAALCTYLWVTARLEKFLRCAREDLDGAYDRLDALDNKAPVLAPDPRVDDLVRVVSTLRGAEALKQVFGKSN